MRWRDGIPDALVSIYIMLEKFDEAAEVIASEALFHSYSQDLKAAIADAQDHPSVCPPVSTLKWIGRAIDEHQDWLSDVASRITGCVAARALRTAVEKANAVRTGFLPEYFATLDWYESNFPGVCREPGLICLSSFNQWLSQS